MRIVVSIQSASGAVLKKLAYQAMQSLPKIIIELRRQGRHRQLICDWEHHITSGNIPNGQIF